MTASDDTHVEYDADSGTYRTSYDPDTESPSVRLIESVAAIKDVSPTALEQLDKSVDPDALDAVFGPTRNAPGNHGSVSFVYEGLTVVVHSDGEIEFREQV